MSNVTPSITEEEYNALEANYATRYEIKPPLPDGRTAVECRCGQTIAITTQHKGKPKLIIHLRGCKDPVDMVFNLGGRCPRKKCNLAHYITLEKVLEILGYPTFEALFRAHGFTEDDEDAWVSYFHGGVILRSDGASGCSLTTARAIGCLPPDPYFPRERR